MKNSTTTNTTSSTSTDPSLQTPVFDSRLGRLLGFDQVKQMYDKAPAALDTREFLEYAIQTIGATYEISTEDFKRIPQTGPLVVVANHPFGGLDGIILADILLRCRDDVRILTNFFLQQIEQLKSIFFSVDPFDRSGSTNRSVAGLRQGIQWLKQGGMLALFPSGTVSHFQVRRMAITDPEWKRTAAGIIHKTQVDVLPLHMSGCNSLGFQLGAMLHPTVRTALLPREILNKSGCHVQVNVGPVIPHQELSAITNYSLLTQYLRKSVFDLARSS